MNLDFLKNYHFFTGVPDSLLKPLCSHLMSAYGICKHHIIAANEGNAAALAAGYHLATGKVPVVYMQNSGLGNIINPAASLMNDNVYGIPCIFIVGWRGEPDVHDEPQHIFQGQVTIRLLEDMDIQTFIITKATTQEDVIKQLNAWKPLLDSGKQVAFVVQKGALECDSKVQYKNEYTLCRERVIERIAETAGEDPIISTTGKASRELFEIREKKHQSHQYDFLTVGSMGHSSTIALGIALYKPETKIWCIDGDGAALMHMGAMAIIGAENPKNLVHVLINNTSHETVGGMPTVANHVNFVQIARACGYQRAVTLQTETALTAALEEARANDGLTFIEVRTAIGSRADLGRPTVKAIDNKQAFMNYLETKK